MIIKIKGDKLEIPQEEISLNKFIGLFHKWDIGANARIFANKTERKAAQQLLDMKDYNYWKDSITNGKFDKLYGMKYFPSNLVSYKPTEMLRNYKKIKAWATRQ